MGKACYKNEMQTKTVSRDLLAEYLCYEKAGFFRWVKGGGRRRLGSAAGTVNKSDGYAYVQVNGERFAAHRLAWLWVHGSMPEGEIDHINGIRHDNRICNLRVCTRSENARNKRRLQRNNTSGHSGVYWSDDRGGHWFSEVYLNGKAKRLGRFDCIQDAIAARQQAVKRTYGEFAPANQNR